MIFRKNDGFTLVELMVTILVSTLVAAAAATTILFGLRINKQSSQTQRQQSTTRILITALEDMASQGSVGEVVSDFGAWELRAAPQENLTDPDAPKEQGKILCFFRDGAICSADGTVIMDGVLMSNAMLNEERTLLTVDVETSDGIFTTSIRCRMPPEHSGEAAPEKDLSDLTDKAEDDLTTLADTKENRTDFLNVLVKERDSKGWITLSNPLEYYSYWYITTKEGQTKGQEMWDKKEWTTETPWCACFISWALNQQKNTLYIPQVTFKNESGKEETLTWINEAGEPYWFADVDKFMAYFQLLHDEKLVEEEGAPQYWVSMRNQPDARPNPGDIIFFDTDLRDADETTNHVGVVFHVDKKLDASGIDLNPNDDVIYTIEGNSLGKVAIRQYSATNKTILGYGVLPWIPNLETLLVGKWTAGEKTMEFGLIGDNRAGTCLNAGGNEVDCIWSYDADNNRFGITPIGESNPHYVEIEVVENTLRLTWDGNEFTRPIEATP